MPFIDVNPEVGRAFLASSHSGPITMLNLLRFNAVADYASAPQLEPKSPISGREAYALYGSFALPLLKKAGATVVFSGEAGKALIGPQDEIWDMCLLVSYDNKEVFFSLTQNDAYRKIFGHRTAALADSRLIPLTD